MGSIRVSMAGYGAPRTGAIGQGIVSVPHRPHRWCAKNGVGAGCNSLRILLPEINVVEIHVVRMDVEFPFPATVRSSGGVEDPRSAFHSPTRGFHNLERNVTGAGRTGGGDRYHPRSVTGFESHGPHATGWG